MYKCIECGIEFENSKDYVSTKFCSKHCKAVYTGKQCKHHVCNLKNRKAPFGTWKCPFCDYIGDTRYELYNHKKEIHNYTRTSWNKGQTMQSNESVLKGTLKLRNKYKIGEIKAPWKDKHLSDEHKEKLSLVRSRALNNSAGFKDVKWYHIKNINDEDYIVRGRWEENVAKYLNAHNILWQKGQMISYIKDGQKRIYNPDFYLPQLDKYIEVKGYYSDKDRLKMKLVHEQNKDKCILFIDQYRYLDFINDKLSLSETDLSLYF